MLSSVFVGLPVSCKVEVLGLKGSGLFLWKQPLNLVFFHGATMHLSVCLSVWDAEDLILLAQHPGFQQCLQSVNVPCCLTFLPYVVTGITSLSNLFGYLSCVSFVCVCTHIRAYIWTWIHGGQRPRLDIFSMTFFWDNPEPPQFVSINCSARSMGSPVSSFPKQGEQKHSWVPGSPARILTCLAALYPLRHLPSSELEYFFKRRMKKWTHATFHRLPVFSFLQIFTCKTLEWFCFRVNSIP